MNVDESKASFLLTCEDADETMPVKYRGHMPNLGSEIIVYGVIKEAEMGKYIFLAENVKVK